MRLAITLLTVAVIGLVVLFLNGCSASNLKKIDAANNAARQLRLATAPLFDERCSARVDECKKQGTTNPEKCTKWIKCRDARRVFYAAISSVHRLASIAATAAILGDKPKLGPILIEVLQHLERARQLAVSAGAL